LDWLQAGEMAQTLSAAHACVLRLNAVNAASTVMCFFIWFPMFYASSAFR
jgi:hypothetical protein